MRSKFVLFICFSLLVLSCDNSDSTARIKALETKIESLSSGSANDTLADSDNAKNKDGINKINQRLNSLESSLKKMEKSIADLSKKQSSKKPSKPSGPWKRDYKYKTSVGNSYYQGPKDAKVVITEWSDYF